MACFFRHPSSSHQPNQIPSCMYMQDTAGIVPFIYRNAPSYRSRIIVGGLHVSDVAMALYICRHGSTWRVLLSRRLRRSASFCTMSITNADIKATGELAVGPLLSRKRVDSSTGSSLEKDAFKGHATIGHASGTGHGIDPSKHSATFETSGNESFFVPIEKYEGRHRYDPAFEWEPLEERKLVRKVCTHSQTISCLVDQS